MQIWIYNHFHYNKKTHQKGHIVIICGYIKDYSTDNNQIYWNLAKYKEII